MFEKAEKDHNYSSEWYHVTTLSNFVRGYDKYKRCYSKVNIPQSTFPNQFFLLKEDQLHIGVSKANKLLLKLSLKGDRLVILKTHAPHSNIFQDHTSGIGQYIKQNYIELDIVYYLANNKNYNKNNLLPMRIEDVVAQSFEVVDNTLVPWSELKPRTISILPIAMACQASCRFCFSKASVSSDFRGRISNWDRISLVLQSAKEKGAQRAVITGGGEPTLVKHKQMIQLIKECSSYFDTIVLITNAHLFGMMKPENALQVLLELDKAGLSVLAISRHHHDAIQNAYIMGLDTKVENVTQALRGDHHLFSNLLPRFICVLQEEGISNITDVEDYLSWSIHQGVKQVNFKELYVSTGNESAYSDLAANEYSAQHQVSLKIIYDFVDKHSWKQTASLPWGAPIFHGLWKGEEMQIAAYTEPSVYWERTNGIARSWNLMSDGAVLASLEDRKSKIVI